jgi:hypothetical protein
MSVAVSPHLGKTNPMAAFRSWGIQALVFFRIRKSVGRKNLEEVFK